MTGKLLSVTDEFPPAIVGAIKVIETQREHPRRSRRRGALAVAAADRLGSRIRRHWWLVALFISVSAGRWEGVWSLSTSGPDSSSRI